MVAWSPIITKNIGLKLISLLGIQGLSFWGLAVLLSHFWQIGNGNHNHRSWECNNSKQLISLSNSVFPPHYIMLELRVLEQTVHQQAEINLACRLETKVIGAKYRDLPPLATKIFIWLDPLQKKMNLPSTHFVFPMRYLRSHFHAWVTQWDILQEHNQKRVPLTLY
jgi:hypothetical protein